MRKFLFVSAFFLGGAVAHAQIFGFSSATAKRFASGATLPTTCTAYVDVFGLTAGGSPGYYFCTATNTWTLLDPGAGVESVSGTTDEIDIGGTAADPIVGISSNYIQYHDLLSTQHSDVTPAAPVRGDLLTAQGASPLWAALAKGTQYQVLAMGANEPAWTALNLAQAAAVTGILGSANGGTGNGFAKLAGPASTEKTWTGPNADATLLTSNDVVTIAQGGTGLATAFTRTATIPTAGCNNATAGASLDLPTSNAATPTCYGTSYRFGALDFADSANQTGSLGLLLPTGWTGNVDMDLWAFVNATSQSVKATLQTFCLKTSADVLNPTFNAAQTITVTSPATANQSFKFSQAAVTMTNCAAGDTLRVIVGRDVTDTSTATYSIYQVIVTLRVTPQA